MSKSILELLTSQQFPQIYFFMIRDLTLRRERIIRLAEHQRRFFSFDICHDKMITFKLSFLLSFPLEGKKKPKSVFSAAKFQNRSQNVIEAPLLPGLLGCAHINYELVPGKCRYDLDVVCWGAVSKIITKEGQITMRTIIRDGEAWVPFCVDHNLGNFKLEEVRKFREHIVKFNITSNETVSRILNVPSYDIEQGDSFYEIVEDVTRKSVLGSRKDDLENYLRVLVMRCTNYTQGELVSWLHGPDNYKRFYEIMDYECSGKEYHCRQFIPPNISPEDSSNQRQSDPKKVNLKAPTNNVQKDPRKRNDSTDITIMVPAEVFFTDSNLSIYRSDLSNGVVSRAFVFITVESLMTKAQKLILNSLIIKIKKIVNIPVDVLQQIGIETIFFKYIVPSIATCKSVAKPLADTIRFEENHIYFTDQAPKLKLIEFLQSQRFFVEIYGNRVETPEEPHCSLFGEEPDDLNISKILNYSEDPPPELPNPILLAMAAYDVSSLLDNVWDFREIGQCHIPNLTFFQKSYSSYDPISYSDVKTVNEVNLLPQTSFKYPVVLQEATLLTLGTSLEIEAYLMAPQAASLILHQVPNTFKRLFIIFYDEDLAKLFYSEVSDHNIKVVEEVKSDPELKNPELQDIITGFFLDNGNDFAMFVEGPSIGFILNVRHIVDQCPPNQAKVFFNTENAFAWRLYNQFLYEGIFTITLKIPLQDILAKYELYLKKNVPVPCMEALKKFSLLFHSSSFKSILQQNIFPGPRELISLDLEWGIPLRWKKQGVTVVGSMFF